MDDEDFSTTDNDPADDSPAYSSGAVTSANPPSSGDSSSAADDFADDNPDAASEDEAAPMPLPDATKSSPRRRNKIFGEDLAQRGIGYYTNLGGGTAKDGMGDTDAGQTIRTIQPNFLPPSWSFDRTTSTSVPPSPLVGSGPAPLDPRQFPVTAARQKLEIAQQAAEDAQQQTTATLRALGVPLIDNSGGLLDLGNAAPDSLRAYIDNAFDQESASADATARQLWSFGGTNLTASAQALRADIERRRAQALAALGDDQQALSDVQAASDQFDQVRAPSMAQNLQDLAALNARRAAAGQPPVPPPDHWVRLAALAPPPASPGGDNSPNRKPDDLRAPPGPGTDASGGTVPDTASLEITDETGTPLTSYEPSTGIGYDASGNPRKVSFDPATGAPHLSGSLYDTAPIQEDEKGNVYRAPEGLAWQWSGVDPAQAARAVTEAIARQDQPNWMGGGEKLDMEDPATRAGVQWLAAQARRQLDDVRAAQQASTDALSSTTDRLQALGVPLVDANGTPLDLGGWTAEFLQQQVADYFDRQYAALQVAERSLEGQDSSNPATAGVRSALEAYRQSLDAAKPQALQTLAAYLQVRDHAASASDQLGQLSAPMAAEAVKELLSENELRAQQGQPPLPMPEAWRRTTDRELGLNPGQDGLGPPDHIPGLPDYLGPPLQPPATPPTPEELQHAIASARAGLKSYGVDDQNGLQFQPENIADGLRQAVQDGLVDPQWATAHLADFQTAQDKYQQLEHLAGGAQELKALLHGGGLGAAFWGGSIPGARIGAEIGAAIPGAGETGVPELIGGALGGLVTGSMSAYAAHKFLDLLGEYSSVVRSLNASAQLHPGYDAAGQLLGMSLNGPKALTNVYRVAQLASEVGTTADGIKAALKIVGSGAGSGAAFETTVRPAFDLARNAVLDQLGLPHDQFQSPTLRSIITNAALGVLTAGQNIEFKDYSAQQVAGILTRAQLRDMAGVSLDAELTPQEAAQAASRLGLDHLDPAKLATPLSQQEISLFNAVGTRAAQMKATGLYDGATVTGVTARQAQIRGSASSEGTPLATSASIATQPGKPALASPASERQSEAVANPGAPGRVNEPDAEYTLPIERGGVTSNSSSQPLAQESNLSPKTAKGALDAEVFASPPSKRAPALPASEPVIITFPMKGVSLKKQADATAHLAEQEAELNRLSMEEPEMLKFNLANYQNLKPQVKAASANARVYLSGDGIGLHAAHKLDAVAGGYIYNFAGFRSPIQSYIGSLWRARASQIVPGRLHRLVPKFEP